MKIGIIGAGTMGQGIAQTFAAKPGNEVLLCDVTGEAARAGEEKIRKDLYGGCCRFKEGVEV